MTDNTIAEILHDFDNATTIDVVARYGYTTQDLNAYYLAEVLDMIGEDSSIEKPYDKVGNALKDQLRRAAKERFK